MCVYLYIYIYIYMCVNLYMYPYYGCIYIHIYVYICICIHNLYKYISYLFYLIQLVCNLSSSAGFPLKFPQWPSWPG